MNDAASKHADPYATPKANIRDTVKWMAAAYSAVAAALLAGSPFAGLGALSGCRLTVAVVAGAAALMFVLLAINETLRMLTLDYSFPNDLKQDTIDFINAHAADILPARFTRYEDLLAARETARQTVRDRWAARYPDQPPISEFTDEQKKELRERYDRALASANAFEPAMAKIVGLAHLFVLQQRMRLLRYNLAALTAAAVVCLAACVWAVTLPR